MAPQNILNLPPEIQLDILEWLREPQNYPNGPNTSLSIYASVCKRWQLIVEQRTFRHLILHPSDIEAFARLACSYRRGYIKHILLEIPIEDTGCGIYGDEALTDDENTVIFTQSVRHLWEVLSTWRDYRITVELGIVSSFEEKMYDGYENIRRAYSRFLEQGFYEAALPDPHLEHLKHFETPPTDPSWLDIWNFQKWRILGTKPLEFGYGRLLDREDQDPPHIPKAEVITRLLIRRRYFRNISAKAISQIFNATPCVEVIHFERWCYGRRRHDKKWDMHSALIGHELPHSLKQFSFYEEFSTMYHRQPGKMRIPRSNRKLLKGLLESRRNLEHLSVSFAIDAWGFFSPNPQPDWMSLKTIALTSDILVSRSSVMVNELLESAAKAAKKMPKLEILEIWYCKTGEAGIFQYEKSDRSGNIIWQGTWSLYLSKEVEEAWHEVFAEPELGRYELGVKVINLVPEDFASFGSVFSHLKLRKHIFHDVSWTQV